MLNREKDLNVLINVSLCRCSSARFLLQFLLAVLPAVAPLLVASVARREPQLLSAASSHAHVV